MDQSELAEMPREDKIANAKDLYNQGSRNFLVKNYEAAADDLSQVCALYEELHGPLCDELGMPYLLYAKSLIALSMEENKVLDVPEEEDEDEAANDEENKENGGEKVNGVDAAGVGAVVNGDDSKMEEDKEADESQVEGANGLDESKIDIGEDGESKDGENEDDNVSIYSIYEIVEIEV